MVSSWLIALADDSCATCFALLFCIEIAIGTGILDRSLKGRKAIRGESMDRLCVLDFVPCKCL